MSGSNCQLCEIARETATTRSGLTGLSPCAAASPVRRSTTRRAMAFLVISGPAGGCAQGGRAVTVDPLTIKVGETTREDVLQRLRSPAVVSAFGKQITQRHYQTVLVADHGSMRCPPGRTQWDPRQHPVGRETRFL
jgi:hypothetical protein